MRSRALFAIIAVALSASACSSGGTSAPSTQPATTPPSTQSPSPSPPPAGSVKLTQADFQFSPVNLVISKSQGLTISNQGPSLHNFTIPGTQVDVDVQPGSTDQLEAIGQVVKVGKHPFFCKYHKARGMVGVITVVP